MPLKAVSDTERQAICAYYFSQKPPPKQKEVIAWFKQQYRRKLGQAVTQVGDDAREPETFLHPKGEDDEPNKQVDP